MSEGGAVLRLIKPILVLPGTMVVLVPGLLLWLGGGAATPLTWLHGGSALVLGGAGLSLAVWTVRLFVTLGRGTPAPWDPPARLVVAGPYRHLRNPMISGVILILAAEAILFRSPCIAGWLALFALANAVYFPLVEEPGLERRFGADYRAYKAHVPRWLPRLTPWDLPG